MILLKELLLNEGEIPTISLQNAIDRAMFGPMYHGTSKETQKLIDKEGFKIFKGAERSGAISHGYESSNYWNGIPAPIHHLGYGVYFTTKVSIAKQYNHGTLKGLTPYFLDSKNMHEINFGSNRTMMKWWIDNGYNYKISPETTFGNGQTNLKMISEERIRATENLTNELKSKYDAVHYLGKGLYTLLDGDQVCVYDVNKVFKIDQKLSLKGEVGSKVKAIINIDRYNTGKIDVPEGTTGIILKKQNAADIMSQHPLAKSWIGDANTIYDIKWKRGGTQRGILDKWIELI